MNDNILFFDIETKADMSAVDSIEVKPPANYKDPDKIAQFIEDAKAEAISKMALDPDLANVLCISYKSGDGETQCLIGDESNMLRDFWKMYSDHNQRVCGYNIVGFDLPFMLRRTMALDVKLPVAGWSPIIKKYSTHPTIDLMGIMYNWEKAKSLKWVARRYGLTNPLPELNGSMVSTMDQETLVAYAKSDVELAYQLYHKMLGIYF